MTKRDDLQWLRALAIIAVVSFHLQPNIFPFGYLGVDIFFVISGYLMTSILSKSPDTVTFYLRRIKRIFPVYFLTITVFFVIGYLKLLPSHFDFLKAEVLFSIFFVNNFPSIFEKKEYFQMISEFKFLLHTWSLSVEIQFYLIAPFLIKFILSKTNSLFWTTVIGILSCSLQLIIPNNAMAFGLVFCRIWQFLVGTFAFLFSNQNYVGYVLVADSKKLKISSCISAISYIFLIFLCFIPLNVSDFSFASSFFRAIITVLTGIFIALNTSQSFYIPSIINTIFVYIGDISYVIYLIHWPIIIYFKYFHINYGDFFTILCIFASTLLIHECFEKPFGKLSWIYNIPVIFTSFGIIVILCLMKKQNISSSLDPIFLNDQEANLCRNFYDKNSCTLSPVIEKYFTFRPPGETLDRYCSIKLNSKSNQTILITGNSYAYFQIRGILEAIKQSKKLFNEVFVITHPGCNLLAGKLNNNFYKPCKGIETSHDQLLNVIKPNIIIYSGRIDEHFPLNATTTFNVSSDLFYKEINRQILHIAKYTDRLIIIEPNPPFIVEGYLNPSTIARTLLLHIPLNKFNISVQEYHQRHYPSWNRVKEAVKHCKNCVIVPTEKIMCPSETCPMVDPLTEIGIFCDTSHITPRQSLKFVPNIIKAIEQEKPLF